MRQDRRKVSILVLCQLGGLGVMTFTAILVLIISGRLGLRRRQAAQAEQGLIAPGEVRSILIGVAILTAIIESLVALVLFLRFLSLGEGFGRALWYGVFHSVTAFNNAGFTLFPDGLSGFVGDPIACVVAESFQQAKDAAEAVAVEIDPLPGPEGDPAQRDPLYAEIGGDTMEDRRLIDHAADHRDELVAHATDEIFYRWADFGG